MNRRKIRSSAALAGAVGLVIITFTLPAQATNLLLNPGMEYPTFSGNTTTVAPTNWTYYSIGTTLDMGRETFYNNTPGGTASQWLKVFEAGQQGMYQTFSSGVQANTSYTFSSYYYFEPNFGGTDAVVDVEMTFLSASNADLGDYATYIYASGAAQTDDSAWASGWATAVGSPVVGPATAAWTQYSVTANAPAGTTKIVVGLDYYAANASSGPQLSAFADDADLEGAGNPPTIPYWGIDSSGDWNNTANWSTFVIPNAIGAEADFLGQITANRNVYTDTAVTVGTLKFNNTNKYVIDGAGSLTLQTGSGSASVVVQAGTQEINLPLTIASNTQFNVSGGATLVIADPMSINSGLSVTQTGGGTVTYESTVTVGSGSMFAMNSSTHAHALTLLSGSSASIGGTGTVVELDSLSLTSAKLDVGKDQVRVDYTGASPVSTLVNLIKTAYNHGSWNGNGITTSAALSTPGTSLGYSDSGTQVKIMFTWTADLNLDGVVNGADLTAFNAGNGSSWGQGDLNYDGVKNADDSSLFLYSLAIAGSRNISSVPEPSALGLVAAAAILRRRRRA